MFTFAKKQLMGTTDQTNNNKTKKCFVCGRDIKREEITYNKKTNLPVCPKCRDTKQEENSEREALNSLSEGFICGCI